MWFKICDFLKEHKQKKQTEFIGNICNLTEDYYGGLYTDEEFMDEFNKIYSEFK